MESLAKRHPEVSWLVIYTREAHPGEITPEHHSLADKRAADRHRHAAARRVPAGRELLDPAVMGLPIVWLASDQAAGVHDERIIAVDFERWLSDRNARS